MGSRQSAVDFELQDTYGNTVRLSDRRGRWVVLYFYPKDNTLACTREAIDFSEHYAKFEAYGACVFGISPDPVASHRHFSEKKNLVVPLLSDPTHVVAEAYGAWRMKTQCGQTFPGIVRSTFLVDPEGFIVRSWDKVRVDGHVGDVLSALQTAIAERK